MTTRQTRRAAKVAPPNRQPDRATAGFGPRERAGLRVSAEVLTWDLCIFRVQDLRSGSTAFVARRGPHAEAFLARFDAGELDTSLRTAISRSHRRRLHRR